MIDKIKKIIYSLFGQYTRKQKIISFFISFGFSLLVIIAVSYNLLISQSSFEYNPLAFIDNQIVDGFFIRRYKSEDAINILRGDKAMSLAVVKIDDDSLLGMGLSWPIPRSVYGDLLNKLKRGGAKTVGFDIIFADPSTPEEDEKFANALNEMNNVFLADYFYHSSDRGGDSGADEDLSGKVKVAEPYRLFADAVQGRGENRLGFVSVRIGKVVRRMDIAKDLEGITYFALAPAMAAHFLNIPQSQMINHATEGYFQMGDMRIPTSQDLVRINYLLPPSEWSRENFAESDISDLINEFSLKQVLEMKDDDLLKMAFKDKIVIIGPTAEGAGDIKQTPFGHIPGVYCHANIILSMLTGKFLTPAKPVVNIVTILIVGVVMGLVIPYLGPLAGAIFTVFLCFGYYEYAYMNFAKQGVINFVSSPILCAFFGFLVINVYHHLVESKAKAGFSKMLREFAPVPTELIQKYIEEYGGSAATGGQLAHMTILFADIRGYTQMSENMTSQEVMDVLNEYHEAMGDIFAKTGGVIFTYIGDAQLVVYGLEGESKTNHAAAAIRAGLLMQEKMAEIKQKLEEAGRYSFEVGVGLCTGSLSIGVVGSEHLKQFTVIGDTVNVASRIQGMSRELNAPTLIHERTYLMAKHCIEAERLRPVKLKGKKELVNVYRAKRVLEITPYPGDEIKDLDREVEELHIQMEEERRLRRQKREEAEKLAATEKESSGQDEGSAALPAGVRRRQRISKQVVPEDLPPEDDLEPLEEQSKGSTPDEEDFD